MTFLKMVLHRFKEWLNENNEPKYLSGKNRAVKRARNKQKYLSGKTTQRD